MTRPTLVVLVVILLVGSGLVFAQYSPQPGSAGLNGEKSAGKSSSVAAAVHEVLGGEEYSPKDGRAFGQAVAQSAREAVYSREDPKKDHVSIERSDVAKAVHEVLGGGEFTPEDGRDFGQAVAEQARSKGPGLGQAVSEAARGANSSMGRGRP